MKPIKWSSSQSIIDEFKSKQEERFLIFAPEILKMLERYKGLMLQISGAMDSDPSKKNWALIGLYEDTKDLIDRVKGYSKDET